MTLCPRPLLVMIGLVVVFGACSKRDKAIHIADDDAEMATAIAKARSTLPEFWQVFEKREHGERGFALKVKIVDKKETEHFWLTDIQRRDGQVQGTVNNDPDFVKNIKFGDRIPIPEADISDWLYIRDGKMYGNRTLRVLFKKMPPAEVNKFKKIMAEP